MHTLTRTLTLATLMALVPVTEGAEDADRTAREAVASRMSGVTAEDLSASPVDGLFQLTIGPQIFYVSADGRYLLRGDLIDLTTNGNLTEGEREAARLDALGSMGDEHMVVFSPDGPVRHTLNVFTDVTCTYCRRFHAEIDQYMQAGVEVRYLFFPRSGPHSGSWETSRRVWCADDRQTALTRAKRDQSVDAGRCVDDPVGSHYSLGRAMGVTGTPSIVTGTGELIPGYLPFDRMMARLREGEEVARKP